VHCKVSDSLCLCVQVKTHLQSKANEASIAVGHQHKHDGTVHAFSSIYKKEGFMGLWRGTPTMVPRIAIASATQLTSFEVIHGIIDQFNRYHFALILSSHKPNITCTHHHHRKRLYIDVYLRL